MLPAVTFNNDWLPPISLQKAFGLPHGPGGPAQFATFGSEDGLPLKPVEPGQALQLHAMGTGIVLAHGDKEVFQMAQS